MALTIGRYGAVVHIWCLMRHHEHQPLEILSGDLRHGQRAFFRWYCHPIHTLSKHFSVLHQLDVDFCTGFLGRIGHQN